MEGRDATDDDADALESFACSNSAAAWDTEVEELVHSGLSWRSGDPTRRLILFEDAGRLVAVAGFGRRVPSDFSQGFWFYFLALSCDVQGFGFGGVAFYSITDLMAAEESGATLGWIVHVDNYRSAAMCRNMGFEDWIRDPLNQHYRIFRTRLPARLAIYIVTECWMRTVRIAHRSLRSSGGVASCGPLG